MSNQTCVVFGCKNTHKNCKDRTPPISFYSFPKKQTCHEIERRQKWIRFAARETVNNKEWEPSKWSRICSAHFVNNQKSKQWDHPSHNPTIHPIPGKSIKPPDPARLVRRLIREENAEKAKKASQKAHNSKTKTEKPFIVEPRFKERFTQTELYLFGAKKSPFFSEWSCGWHSSTEASTQISHDDKPYLEYPKKVSNDKCVGTEEENKIQIRAEISEKLRVQTFMKTVLFRGYDSVVEENQFQKLAGVSSQVFNIFLGLLSDYKPRANTKENLLLAFFTKLKTGEPFSFLSVIFNTRRSTTNNAFYDILDALYDRIEKEVSWLPREDIKKTLPGCFKDQYANTRVILHSIEIKTETSHKRKHSNGNSEDIMLSDLNSSRTVKYLFGIAPNGKFTFISKAFGGHTSDSDIVQNSGIMQKLELDDIVLADKSLSTLNDEHIITTISSGIYLHMERTIQRLKLCKILSQRFPVALLPAVDKIVRVCAALANLQSNTIKSTVASLETECIELSDSDE